MTPFTSQLPSPVAPPFTTEVHPYARSPVIIISFGRAGVKENGGIGGGCGCKDILG